jgi:hypothetical protein
MTKQVQLRWGYRVRVTSPESPYYGEQGMVIDQGRRYGHVIVEIVKDGKVYTPEIARGRLELVQEGEDAHAEPRI